MAKEFRIGTATVPARPLEPALYLVATPIGNLADITLRALETLAGADVLACEDTRVTRVLLDRYGIVNRPYAYHEHNADEAGPRLIAALEAGKSVALVSDAGTPLVSDPGYRLGQAAIEAGHRVIPIPGPSAAITALVAAGLPTDRFFFEGFLPQKSGARRNRLGLLAGIPGTLVLFEAPHRLPEMLADAVASGKSLEEAGVDFVKAHRPSSIIQRAATVEEVANLCVYIASPQASATTGAALRVDGGVVNTIA